MLVVVTSPVRPRSGDDRASLDGGGVGGHQSLRELARPSVSADGLEASQSVPIGRKGLGRTFTITADIRKAPAPEGVAKSRSGVDA